MEDFLFLDELLQPEEKQIRSKVSEFISKIALPLIPNAYEQGQFPVELVPHIAQLGLLKMNLPVAYGGRDLGPVSYGLACQELEKGDSALRSFVSVQSALAMYPIFEFGTEEQKQQFLPAMSRGEVIGCFGFTEPQGGSDPANMCTTAEKIRGGWRLNGTKRWVTNGTIANIGIIWAKTELGIRGFIVDINSEGLQVNPLIHKLSLRASASSEIIFKDCFIADDRLLPGTSRGLKTALSCLNEARYGIAWGAIGAAMACYDIALEYTKNRELFGKSAAGFQLVQKDLTEMFTEIIKAQCLNLQVGRLKDQRRATPAMISMAKMNACEHGLQIARMARNLLGANGIILEYNVMRHMVNLESVFTYEGTDNIHHLIVGQHITGLNAF